MENDATVDSFLGSYISGSQKKTISRLRRIVRLQWCVFALIVIAALIQ